jgi:hypothetical protein
MTGRITNLEYHGQPVYRDWMDGKRKLIFTSREIKHLADGSWQLVRYIPLSEIRVDRRHSIRRIMEQVRQAELGLVKIPGVRKIRFSYA